MARVVLLSLAIKRISKLKSKTTKIQAQAQNLTPRKRLHVRPGEEERASKHLKMRKKKAVMTRIRSRIMEKNST
jgi:hypothetical protein